MVDTGSWRTTLSLNTAISSYAVAELLDEIDAQEATIARLRAITDDLADADLWIEESPGWFYCVCCNVGQLAVREGIEDHTPSCVWMRAGAERDAALAPTQAAATTEDTDGAS